jgi:FAD/FMN-containing dehydrogenase
MDATRPALLQLIDRVRGAQAGRCALDIRGGGTKRFYGNPPRGEALEVAALSGISSYEPTELVVTVLAGTPLAELEEALRAGGQCLAFEPPHFGASATVGGMVAAGIAGPARASAGPVRDFVLGATLLNAAGELLTFGGQVMKNVAGYDVSRVLAGSMGILGVICEVSLKVMPVAPECTTLGFDADESRALELLNRWAGGAVPVTGSVWHADRLHVRLAGARAAVARAVQALGGRAMDPDEAAGWWRAVRDQRHEFFDLADHDLDRGECLWRLSVPDSAPPLDAPGRRFLEWGGAQRWWRTDAPAARMRTAAAAVGGHATLVRARDKSPGAFTALTPSVMQVHRRLKQSFDPAGIFNPGRLYPEL